jgi:hypothetical protein
MLTLSDNFDQQAVAFSMQSSHSDYCRIHELTLESHVVKPPFSHPESH